jgi:hypothetical protein
MIVRNQPNGQLLCIHQTSHALMAAEFCRHWGNADFAIPTPYTVVMNAIEQHDNGWYEWECAPEIGEDGAPLDFMRGPAAQIKLALWQRGIDRAAAQHPYAGLMVSRHATLLYTGDLARLDEDERSATEAFIAKQKQNADKVRQMLARDTELHRAASEPVLLAHTRLLQFGDSSSLQVSVPWSNERVFPHCPVDFAGTYATLTLRWEASEITVDPWPYDVDHFTVSTHGRLLNQNTFPNNAAYQAALAAVPLQTLTWHVIQN